MNGTFAALYLAIFLFTEFKISDLSSSAPVFGGTFFPSFRYLSVLVELTRVEGLSHGNLVASQLLDVAVRVQTIRPFAVQQMSLLLENPFAIFGLTGGNFRAPNMTQVLYASAWICGEYVE